VVLQALWLFESGISGHFRLLGGTGRSPEKFGFSESSGFASSALYLQKISEPFPAMSGFSACFGFAGAGFAGIFVLRRRRPYCLRPPFFGTATVHLGSLRPWKFYLWWRYCRCFVPMKAEFAAISCPLLRCTPWISGFLGSYGLHRQFEPKKFLIFFDLWSCGCFRLGGGVRRCFHPCVGARLRRL